MRIKLDENLPVRLAEGLRDLQHDVASVLEESLGGQPDGVIRGAAEREGRLLLTQDVGLADLRALLGVSHPGVVLIRLRDAGRDSILTRLMAVFREESVEEWRNCVIVVTDHKIRMARRSE